MKYELPKLPYNYDALEPYIDAQTMEIHHSKHHQGYVTKLNSALEKHPDLQEKPLEDILKSTESLPQDIKVAVRNNGGGHYNHSLFWEIMGPAKNQEPNDELTKAISKNFGDFEKFKEEFSNTAIGIFGSGWVWLVLNPPAVSSPNPSKDLIIITTPNQDSPIMNNQLPILGLDVWEHAYYLKYQNKRPEYIKNWWSVVNWDKVYEKYKRLKK